MNASKKRNLSQEEKQKLSSFLQLLMQIDRREKITPTAKECYKKRTSHGA